MAKRSGSVKSFMIETFEKAGLKPWEKYIHFVRRAYEQGAQGIEEFLTCYDALPSREQMLTTPEAVCEKSGVPQKILFGVIMGQLWELAYVKADMVLALNHPKIVERAVKEALKPGGYKDRENLLKANGVVPIPKNNSVHFHKHVSAPSHKEVAPAPAVLPSFEDDMEAGDDAPLMLPPGQ